MTCAGETLSDAVGGVSFAVTDGRAFSVIARGRASLRDGECSERLAVAGGGGTSSVADDDTTLVFADGVELLVAARGGDTLGDAVGGQTLLVVAGGAEPCSVDG